ncbi:MAG: LytR C-terminal domain-containing protein [Candidatus Eisenbacteria bacterium]
MTWALVRALLLGITMVAVYFAWTTLSQTGSGGSVCEVPIVVEVLNGCGVGGTARGVGEILIDQGCDVMFVGNADDFDHRETLVVDRSGDRSKARAVASVLPGSGVIYQVGSAFFVDVTVVIGSDLAGSLPHGAE